MPDCIYRFSTADKSICLIEPAHIAPCLAKACCIALANHLSPQFKPAMRGKLKFWIQTRDADALKDSRLEVLKSYPHLNAVLVSGFEEDVVRLAQERGRRIENISKAIPFRVVGYDLWHR
jgi:hypothetical protein